MDGLERIQEQIELRGERRIQAIAKRADTYVAEQQELAAKERAAILSEAEESANKDAKALRQRALSLAETNQRKDVLRLRQELLDRLIDEALEELIAAPADEKIARYGAWLDARGIARGTIRLSQKDTEMGPRLIKELKGDFTLGEPADIAGGLLVEQGRKIENLSYDLVLRQLRSDLASEAAAELFVEAGS